ncbi:MAG TPA: hypothetical protein VFC46_07015, partial [Humisphaera sp.]|nr:hypothetical protein [Humisphaera sp.]
FSPTVNLSAGHSKGLKIKFPSPTIIPDGSYYLIAVINPGQTITESNYANNAAVASMPTTITQPFITLAGSIQPAPAARNHATATYAYITVTNNGNVAASGSIVAQALLSPDNSTGIGAVSLATRSQKLKLAPGRSARLRINFVMPSSSSANSYLEGMISFSGALVAVNDVVFFSDLPLTTGNITPALR